MRLLATLGVCSIVAVAGCGGGSGTTTRTDEEPAIVETTESARNAAVSSAADAFAGGTVTPVKAAPELGLRTWDGRPVRLADYRGKAVFVTFLYTSCPDICPVIIDNLVRVKDRLGPAGKNVRVVVISVDPERDTPAAIKRFLVAHRALGDVDYLIGSPAQLKAAWARWGIGARVNKDNPALIEHSGVIWGVDTRGRRATFYPATGFDIDDIAGDARLLLTTR